MKCTQFMDFYLERDRRETIPFFYRYHLRRCPSCKREVRLMGGAETICEDSITPLPRGISFEETIMQRIQETQVEVKGNSVHLYYWLFGGGILFLSMVFVPYTEPVRTLMTLLKQRYQISFSLVMGIVITLYCTFFVVGYLHSKIEGENENTPHPPTVYRLDLLQGDISQHFYFALTGSYTTLAKIAA